ncbi:hypothetical protein I5S53_12050 [Pseudomonas juntendi]|uniref:hypothetical protein n=1 Tax=Pseudomonas juntendi TaxID=2666183 RepID=UPI0018D99427|nr:hypothetical protein [Pseudomonas juntendi]MBH3384693.1 hypothetical protein [Pseudomonas juntendi]MDG9917841.1 hypothetical protein [Pseudomonas juntendi]MDH0506321.1 hypothetical protein [Pseudomonas juntendi]MDH1044557.1 hypothetical protein [Pseudomonas juntendi]
MYTENEKREVSASIQAYLDDNYEYFESNEKWHEKAIEVVTQDLDLDGDDLDYFRSLIIETAAKHDGERDGDGCSYDLAATKEEIYSAVFKIAIKSSANNFVEFRSEVEGSIRSDLIIPLSKDWIVEEALLEYSSLAVEEDDDNV